MAAVPCPAASPLPLNIGHNKTRSSRSSRTSRTTADPAEPEQIQQNMTKRPRRSSCCATFQELSWDAVKVKVNSSCYTTLLIELPAGCLITHRQSYHRDKCFSKIKHRGAWNDLIGEEECLSIILPKNSKTQFVGKSDNQGYREGKRLKLANCEC